jgi:hypothetical protein
MANQEKLVTIRFDRNATTNPLTIDPPAVQVDDGDWVRWEFECLEEDEFAFISFAPPLPRFGPFFSLRSYSHDGVLGKGNKGDPPGSAYGYRALVLKLGEPAPEASGVGMISSNASHENTAPEIQVTYQPGNPPGLAVTPDPVGLNTGDTAVWRFTNLPANTFACFRFPSQDESTPELGPFENFIACNGDDSTTLEAYGTGFAVKKKPKLPENIVYRIELRDFAGQLLVSHEPVIDNLGPPPLPEETA